MISQFDMTKSKDLFNIAPLVKAADKGKVKGAYFISKWFFPENMRDEAEHDLRHSGMSIQQLVEKWLKFAKEGVTFNHVFAGYNLLLNEGINELWTIVGSASSGTKYDNTNAQLGVGDSSTAAAATQTDLQAATNKLFVAMDASYPTYGTAQKITFRSTFGSAQANYAWAEFAARNGATALKDLNRLVSAQGTKTAGQTWQLTEEITLT